MCLELKSAITVLFHWPTHLLHPSDRLHTTFEGVKETSRIWRQSQFDGPASASWIGRPSIECEACPSVFPLLGLILRSSISQWAAAAERCEGDSGPEITLSALHNNTAVDTVLCQELSGFWFTFPPLSSNPRPGRPFRAQSRGKWAWRVNVSQSMGTTGALSSPLFTLTESQSQNDQRCRIKCMWRAVDNGLPAKPRRLDIHQVCPLLNRGPLRGGI